jgi:hypothetical protein
MDSRVTELQCIMPMSNIASIQANGILSYERASKLTHKSVAMQPVQDLRDQKQVPGGLRLHQYANLYFHARNPMLYKRLNEAASLCVLRVSTAVLRIQGAVITDQNAAGKYVRFFAPSQWRQLDFDDIFALSWKHPDDQIAEWRHKSRKCAEVLIPHVVAPANVMGAYVIDARAEARLREEGFRAPITVDKVLFFG